MPQQSLVILKPDAVERHLVGAIIGRLEGLDLALQAAQLVLADEDKLSAHYPDTLAEVIGGKSAAAGTDVGGNPRAYGEMVLGWNRRYMSRGPILVMVWSGESAIPRIRATVGATDPINAEPGTIRGDHGADSIAKANEEKRGTENLVHASGSPEEAATEMSIWFPDLARHEG